MNFLIGYYILQLVVTLFCLLVFGYDLDFKDRVIAFIAFAILLALLILAIILILGEVR